MKSISIIIPAYNEEECLHALLDKLNTLILDDLAQYKVEVIIIDDHSKDNTNQILNESSKVFPWLKYIRLLKNSGSHIAILCGLANCLNEKAVIIGADLQDPPEIIPKLLEKSVSSEANIVLGNRLNRTDPLIKKITSSVFNSIIAKYIFPGFPAGGGDVFLLDRKVIDAVTMSSEKNVNIFVLILSFSDNVGIVDYSRKERFAGKSKWTFKKLFKLAYDTIVTAGNVPVILIRWVGGVSVVISMITIGYIVAAKYLGFIQEIGWPSLMAIISFFGGMMMFALSILGEYIWRNFDQTRKRPIYLIEEKNC